MGLRMQAALRQALLEDPEVWAPLPWAVRGGLPGRVVRGPRLPGQGTGRCSQPGGLKWPTASCTPLSLWVTVCVCA